MRKFKTIRHKSESSAFTAGQKAFQLKIYPDGNPYKNQPKLKTLWFQGYQKAKQFWEASVKRSKEFQLTLPEEE